MGGFQKGGSCNNRFVLKPDVAIASEASNSSKNSLAITDFFAKRTQLANYCGNPPIRDFQLLLVTSLFFGCCVLFLLGSTPPNRKIYVQSFVLRPEVRIQPENF